MAELHQLLFPWRDIEICDATMDTPFNENSRSSMTITEYGHLDLFRSGFLSKM